MRKAYRPTIVYNDGTEQPIHDYTTLKDLEEDIEGLVDVKEVRIQTVYTFVEGR